MDVQRTQGRRHQSLCVCVLPPPAGAITVGDVPLGAVRWAVRWDDVLALELRWSRSELQYPDRLVLHRKGVGVLEGGPEAAAAGESLAHALQCFPGTPQASQIKLVAQKVLRKHYQDPRRDGRLWSERHAAAALPRDVPPAALPPTLLAMDWEMAWHTNPNRSPVVSFWHPVAPAGRECIGGERVPREERGRVRAGLQDGQRLQQPLLLPVPSDLLLPPCSAPDPCSPSPVRPQATSRQATWWCWGWIPPWSRCPASGTTPPCAWPARPAAAAARPALAASSPPRRRPGSFLSSGASTGGAR